MPCFTLHRRAALAGLIASPIAQAVAAQRAFAQSPAPADAAFTAFLDTCFDESLALSPESMTSMGLKTDYGKLDDYTPAHQDLSLAMTERQVARMKRQFDFKALGPQSKISWRLFEAQASEEREGARWRDHRYRATTGSSAAGDIPTFLINEHSIANPAEAAAYVSRLTEVRRVMSEVSANIRRSADKGIVAPAFTFAPIDSDAREVIAGAPFSEGEDSPVWADFKEKVGKLDIPQGEKDRLLAEAKAALLGPFKAGYETFLATQKAVQPLAKVDLGVWSLPDGAAYYAYRLKVSTTTTMTAAQIHQLGLDNLARIQAEMKAILGKVGFTGPLTDFFKSVNSDPQFHYPNTAEGKQAYLDDAKRYIGQVMAKAPQYFQRLPKAALEVRAVESWREQTAPIAFYNQPAPDGSRPGIFYVNLHDMRSVLKLALEDFAYHEGAPGHHFQIARAQELEGLPKFRRFGFYGAYTEGWGLYAERLGKEMGFYQDPYSDFGRLSGEAVRAVRLVVDTGLHAMKWTRAQAIDCFNQNTLFSERDIRREVERYLCGPGQATSYMVGQQKILQLRTKAEAALGPKFDIRAYHEVVLANGALPLDVLEEQVDAWIAQTKA